MRVRLCAGCDSKSASRVFRRVSKRASGARAVAVHVPPRGYINVEMAPHSIRTFVLDS